jgi:outer membrane protein assembly factor BamB
LYASPHWVDGKLYLGTDDGEVKVYAHGKAGKVLATNEMDHLIQSTPMAANGVIYVLTRASLYAIGSR